MVQKRKKDEDYTVWIKAGERERECESVTEMIRRASSFSQMSVERLLFDIWKHHTKIIKPNQYNKSNENKQTIKIIYCTHWFAIETSLNFNVPQSYIVWEGTTQIKFTTAYTVWQLQDLTMVGLKDRSGKVLWRLRCIAHLDCNSPVHCSVKSVLLVPFADNILSHFLHLTPGLVAEIDSKYASRFF